MSDEAYRKGLELLARRPHFEREIDRKLRDRGFDEEARLGAVDRLRSDRYLDDEECARGFVVAKLRRRPMGRRKLRAELGRRGASDQAVDEALSDPGLESEAELARRAARRWRGRGSADRAALMRHLDRQGFSKSDILNVLDDEPELDPSA